MNKVLHKWDGECANNKNKVFEKIYLFLEYLENNIKAFKSAFRIKIFFFKNK